MVVPDSLQATLGCQVTLRCLDGGVAPDFFEWRLDGRVIQSYGRIFISRNGTLVISDVADSDAGLYSCTVRTSLGISMATATLMVQDSLFGRGESPTINSSTPPIQMLGVHQVVQFVCFVSGFPRPRVQWLRDGLPVPAFRRVVSLNETLRIRDLRTTDSAIYQCSANNSEGVATMEFVLRVGGEEEREGARSEWFLST